MKLRESGMPEEAYWESLFDIELILDRLGIDARLRDVVELGCGYGTFTLPVARRIGGMIDTFDIDSAMVERTQQRVEQAGLGNVRAEMRDVLQSGFGSEPESKDACLLFNILHGEEPLRLLREAMNVVRAGGLVFVIHWRYDPATPRGPSMDIRPRPEQCRAWAESLGLVLLSPMSIDLPPYHFGLVFRKPEDRNEEPMRSQRRAYPS